VGNRAIENASDWPVTEGAARTSNEWRITPSAGNTQLGVGGGNPHPAPAEANRNGGAARPDAGGGDATADDAAPLAFRSSVQEACQGTEVAFSMDGSNAKGSFLWNFGDGTFSNDPAPTHVFQRPGTYDITISIRSHNDGMIRTRTVENMIVVRPIPDARLAWKLPEVAIEAQIPVELINQTDRASSAVWILDDQRIDRSAMALNVPGVYDVHLIASNAYGCQDDARGVIKLGDRVGAAAPAVFSPNGDGRYDTFFPGIASSSSANWQLVVVDEQGRKVFESNSVLKPWDGTLATGGRVAPGQTYRWTLSGKDRKGQQMWYSDTVKIER
jgi:plastocyanin